MGGWFETTGVILTAVLGAVVGRIFSRLKNRHWAWGYFVPLALIAFLGIATYVSINAFVPFLVWIAGGRMRFVIIALAVTMGCMTLIGRLKRPFERVIVLVMMIVAVMWGSVLPFLLPTLVRTDLTNLRTKFNRDNVCFQSTNYTCGPAAAVTALRQMGLSAQEGEMAVLSHSSPIVGTLPWCLYKAIQQRYAAEGVDCQLRRFDSVNQLREADVTLVVIRDGFMLDHCVAVLEVGNETVTIGDPMLGRMSLSIKDFEGIWRFCGIALKHDHTQKG